MPNAVHSAWHMAKRSTFPLVDRAVGGDLAGRLGAWRDEGLTYEQISRKLHAEHGIDVASTTVYRWCIEQGVATTEPAA
jgi:hypothetical protein